MASSPRIDELRKKFDENPRRYFAPLANEYRKAGDFQQAIAICREYLPQQPGHMSGHIVFGQALYEARQFDEAKAVFETALSLDPENLIALKHLGDIFLIQGDTETARTWYKKILDADPRNEEILAQLAKLEQKKAGAKVGATMVMQAVPRPGAPPKEPKTTPPAAPAATKPAAPTSPPKPPAAATPPAGIPTNLSNQKTEPIPVAKIVPKAEPTPAAPPAPLAPAVTADSPTQEIRLDTIPTHAPPAAAPAVEPALGLEPTSFGATTPPPTSGPTLEIDTPVSAPKEAPPAVSGFALEGLETTSLAGEAPAPPPPAPTAPPPAPAAPDGLVDLNLDMPAAPPAAAAPPPPPPAPPVAPAAEGLIDLDLPAAPPPAPATPPPPPPPPAPVGEAPAEMTDQSFAPPAAPAPTSAPAPAAQTDDLPLLDLSAPAPTAPAPTAPPAPPVAVAPPVIEEIEPPPPPAPAPHPPAAPAQVAAAPPPPPAASGAFVTETMAELYLQQGHREEALKVYQALLAQRPNDAALRAKVETLSAPPAAPAPSGPTIRELLYVIAVRRPGYRADGVHHGNGSTAHAPAATPAQPALVADQLASLLGDVVVGDYDEWAAQMLALAFMHQNGRDTVAGVPAHAASGDLSLNTVFKGDQAAQPAQQPSNFSFDQFFSQRVTADNPAIPHPQTAAESQEDVAHFTQWLEGLKKK